MLAPDGAIVDPTLVIPLPLVALAEAMKADDAVAHAPLAKRNPVIQHALDAAKLEGELKGELKGKRDAVLRLLARAGIALEDADRTRILACSDAALLDAWLDKVVGARTAADVLSPRPARPKKRR